MVRWFAVTLNEYTGKLLIIILYNLRRNYEPLRDFFRQLACQQQSVCSLYASSSRLKMIRAVLLLVLLVGYRLVSGGSELETDEDFLSRSLAHAAIWQGELEEERVFGRELGAFGPGVRTNFCNNTLKAATSGQSGLAALPIALKGKTVTVAYTKTAPPAYFKLNPTTYRPICESSQTD
jgi:hypothetical protein